MFFQTVASGTAQIEVMMVAEGRPDILVLPEFFGGIRGYAPLLQCLASVGFSPAGINPRSCGASNGSLRGLTLEDLAGDVITVIRSLTTPPVLLAGHAGGQRVGRLVASLWPELVSGMVLLAAGGRVPGNAEARAALVRAADESVPLAERQAAWNRFMFGADTVVPDHLREWGDRSSALATAFRGFAGGNVERWWAGGTAPLLVIQGLEEEIAPVANGHQLKSGVSGPSDADRLGERRSWPAAPAAATHRRRGRSLGEGAGLAMKRASYVG